MPSAHSEGFDEVTVAAPVTSANTSFEAVEGAVQTAGTGVVARIGNGVQITSGDSGGAGWSDCGLFDTGSGKRSAFRAYLRRDVAVTGDDLHFAWMVGRTPGGEIVDSISVPGILRDLAFDGTSLWGSALGFSPLIYKLDPSTGAVLDSFAAPAASCHGLTWDGSHLRVLSDATDTIYRVDPSTGSTVSSVPVTSGNWRGLTWDGANLWAANVATGLVKINPTTGATISTTPKPSGWIPTGLTWDGSHLWLAEISYLNRAHRVDPVTGEVVGSVAPSSGYPLGLTWDGTNLRVATGDDVVATVTVPATSTPLSLAVTTTGTLAGTGLTLDTGDATLPLGEWVRAEAELVANGDDVDATVRLFTGATVDSDNDADAVGVLTGTIAGGAALLADASLLFGRDPTTAPTAGTIVLDDVAFDTYPPLPVVAPGSIVAGMNWWDGTTTLKADLFGWWDGATVQPVDFLGIWDGTTVQPSPE